jgi:8-oxo-dGTP pyrophosphatase MutT (NUDIX family)
MTTNSYRVSTVIPDETHTYQQVAGCFCLYEGRFLLLKRHPEKSQGGKWCLPGGKKENHETHEQTAARELMEETSIKVCLDDLIIISPFCIESTHNKVIFHAYGVKFKELPKVEILLEESIEYRWTNFSELHDIPLIKGGKEILEACLNFLNG